MMELGRDDEADRGLWHDGQPVWRSVVADWLYRRLWLVKLVFDDDDAAAATAACEAAGARTRAGAERAQAALASARTVACRIPLLSRYYCCVAVQGSCWWQMPCSTVATVIWLQVDFPQSQIDLQTLITAKMRNVT